MSDMNKTGLLLKKQRLSPGNTPSRVCTTFVLDVSGWLIMCVTGLTPATSLTYGH